MQMKAQNAPGELTREREPAELTGGVGQSWLHSHGPRECLSAKQLLDF